ncbi:GTPase HflX [Pyrococcus abyssi]|uniref:GTPase HflX n=1 Tax=Pyrococcus abyssi (strain GE5 / Orsay) TaxID=272844 RepID=Q9UZR3_PYRAB|nr:GTPase HflX [Pyrococcus abyssi]CAB49993.1 hflX-like GTP-binding protein hflx [Pyrococcus abyssi GE5]CCE70493.1 TPA: GTP-binding protein hflx [Pyrococcus abyssi GE5]
MRAIGVIRKSRRERVSREEFEELLRSAGYEILAIVEQVREEHPRFNIGPGKLEEIKELVRELNPDKVVFANRLTPSQAYNLWKELRVDIIDKWQLVLEIFEKRAHSKEAKLQVELANLQYELPLVKEAIRRIKMGDRAGFKGMGEYQVHQYFKHIRYRMGKIKDELEKIRSEREIRRKKREEEGFVLVALAGYTNAGKSTLLNALSGDYVEAKNQMFTTLSTTTRRFRVRGKMLLVTDTVGFIDGLPPFIVEAFHSTLEEIVKADIIVLVLDASEPWREVRRKFFASLDVLRELKALDRPMIIALNKIDLVSEEDVQEKELLLRELLDGRTNAIGIAKISAKHKKLEELYELIDRALTKLPKFQTFEIKVKDPSKLGKILAMLHSMGEVLEVSYGNETRIRAYIQTGLIRELNKLGVKLRRIN